MCKGCKEVFNTLDMIDGYCQECAKKHSITKNNQETNFQKEIKETKVETKTEEPKSQIFDLIKNLKLVLWLILFALIVIGIIINSFMSKLDNSSNANKHLKNEYLTNESITKINILNKTPVNSNIVEKICIDGYVYINIYQKKPVMTIRFGNHTALTQFPVLQSTTQSFITNELSISEPEKCENSDKLAYTKPTKKTLSNAQKCTTCHGVNFEKKAMGTSLIVRNMSREDILYALRGYKNDSYGGSMKFIMKTEIALFSDKEILDLANYISSL